MEKELLNIVFIGHVDHGKSTILGRLLADSNGLPDGKLEQVKDFCRKNARPFEYAFLLDALKDEQEQGITIDAARIFFQTSKRNYMFIDAPGHIEFLKNMITGAAKADAAVVVIDAKEGIQENSKRHGYILSMLGVTEILVVINKMDLVDFSQEVFEKLQYEYQQFLEKLNIKVKSFIPVSGRNGDNIVTLSNQTPWFQKDSLLSAIEKFQKPISKKELPFRFPIQDIYKFTEYNDDRRIFVGRIISGTLSVGDEIIVLPSGKKSGIKSIEVFNANNVQCLSAGTSAGVTLTEEIYIKPGEVMVKKQEKKWPMLGLRFRANLFWLGKNPMVGNKFYKLKIGTMRMKVKLLSIESVLDASDFVSIQNKGKIEQNDVANVILETIKPIAFDTLDEGEDLSRFVIIDDFYIAGCGVITEKIENQQDSLDEYIKQRELIWHSGLVSKNDRIALYKHKSKFVILTGDCKSKILTIAKELEKKLFLKNYKSYYLGFNDLTTSLSVDLNTGYDKDENIRRLGEVAHILTEAGLVFITTIFDIDDYDISILRRLTSPNEFLIFQIGNCELCNATAKLDAEESNEHLIEKINEKLCEYINSIEYYI